MDISLFKAFRAKLALGRRRDAAVSLGVFVRSLDTLAKKRQFTEWLLAQRDGRRPSLAPGRIACRNPALRDQHPAVVGHSVDGAAA